MEPTIALLIIAVTLLAVRAVVDLRGWLSHRRWLAESAVLTVSESATEPSHPLLGEMVVVNTHRPDDQSLQGILVTADNGWLVLRAASRLDVKGGVAKWEDLPADAAVPERSVSWIVKVPAERSAIAKVPAEPTGSQQ